MEFESADGSATYPIQCRDMTSSIIIFIFYHLSNENSLCLNDFTVFTFETIRQSKVKHFHIHKDFCEAEFLIFLFRK